jgi:hypothetical protein
MKNKGTVRKNIGFTAVVSGALVAAILGLAGPAAATPGNGFPFPHRSSNHHSQIYNMNSRAYVPHVDTSVRNGTVVCTNGTGCAVVRP